MLSNEHKAIRAAVIARGLRDPIAAYRMQKKSSALREIPFKLTFDEWWGIWKDYYHLRGRGVNGLCMAREGDKGPYAVGNVYLTTNLGNLQDYRKSELCRERRARSVEIKRYGIWGKKSPKIFSAPGQFDWRAEPKELLDEL